MQSCRLKNQLQSPEYVQTSLAASITLGFKNGLFYRNAVLRGLNLLVTYDSKCMASCSYCGLSNSREIKGKNTFIRVAWPTYSLEEIMDAVKSRKNPMQRVCVGMITHPRAAEDTIKIVQTIKKETGLLISVLVTPTVITENDLLELKKAGADMCGIAVDCADEMLFDKYRGKSVMGPHSWSNYWNTMEKAVEIFGEYKVGVHLIVGLGESELEMVSTIQRAYDMGVLTHLFSFYPEPGSKIHHWPQPSYGTYRRIQLARYLINNNLGNLEQMHFNAEHQIVDYGQNIEMHLENGEIFMTSGCAGADGKVACNRPYGNERPSQPIRNFPFMPDKEDLILIKDQLWQDIINKEPSII
ncbi:MAG: radical SAM protein [Clostridia bacterium]|nr:radical SAM protein [Clostridia bacterium]